MPTFNLSVSTRNPDLKTKELNSLNMIPAILYGPLIQPIPLQVPLKDFKLFTKGYDQTSLIDLLVDNTTTAVLIRKIQKHPVNDVIQNIEFYAVDPNKNLTANIPIILQGIAPTVKVDRGVLFHNISSLKVVCTPSAIIPEIIIDISTFTTFDKAIFVRDLNLPEGMHPATDPDELVVKVLRPKVEEASPTTTPANTKK